MTRILTLCSALAVTTLLAACGNSAPECKTEADLAKIQIDIEAKLQKLALDDPEKAMKFGEEMMTMGEDLDMEKAMSGDVSQLCQMMQKAWTKLN